MSFEMPGSSFVIMCVVSSWMPHYEPVFQCSGLLPAMWFTASSNVLLSLFDVQKGMHSFFSYLLPGLICSSFRFVVPLVCILTSEKAMVKKHIWKCGLLMETNSEMKNHYCTKKIDMKKISDLNDFQDLLFHNTSGTSAFFRQFELCGKIIYA